MSIKVAEGRRTAIVSPTASGSKQPVTLKLATVSSLKAKHVVRKAYRMRDEAKADLFDYIERF